MLHQRAKSYHRPPSELYGIEDGLAAFLFDAAVLACGLTVEAALSERVNKGTEKQAKWEARYTLAQLLDPIFRLPRPEPAGKAKASDPNADGFKTLMQMAQNPRSRVKLWHATTPN